jgi:peptidase E
MTQNTKPVFLLAGGRGSQRKKQDTLIQAIYREFGIKSPAIAYTGTASGDDKNFFGFISRELAAAGAGKIAHAVIAPDGADLKKAQKILESADIVFVSGGDVEAGMEVLRAKNMVGFLDNLFRQGKPFFGISAGALMLAQKWVRWPDPDDESSAELFPCLGYAPVICDAHDEQGGWQELRAALMLEKEGVKGYGLASGSGIKVTPDGKVAALGGDVYQYIRRPAAVERIEDILPPGPA